LGHLRGSKLGGGGTISRLEDLMVPLANRLEKLKGNPKGFYSIRINDQWRVIFRWVNGELHACGSWIITDRRRR
jgi:plasmid maintenance system killer protein